MPPVCEQTLPLSLWLRFDLKGRQRLLAVLEFLSPITTSVAVINREPNRALINCRYGALGLRFAPRRRDDQPSFAPKRDERQQRLLCFVIDT
jgi:hypothetical protein